MEEFISILSMAPVVAGIAGIAAALLALWRRTVADEHFIRALSEEIRVAVQEHDTDTDPKIIQEQVEDSARIQDEVLDVPQPAGEESVELKNHKLSEMAQLLGEYDPSAVRHLYFISLMEARKLGLDHGSVAGIFASAMNDLAEEDKKLIKLTLKNNSNKGRVRYLDKVFNAALKLPII